MTRRRTHGTVNRMAYDEGLAQWLREALAHEDGLTERRMFGGIAFMLDCNMAVGVSSDELMVRAGPDRFKEALARPQARVFDLSGRPMKGWVLVAPDGAADDADLAGWLTLGVSFARSLPPK